MATTNVLRSNEVGHVLLGLFCLLLLVNKGNAYEFVVGGQKGWSVPSDPNSNSYNQWAEKNRFQIGDSLVFNYQSGQDSVLQVSSEDYASCNTDGSSEKFSDGHTVIKLKQSGPHYFISGNKDNCAKNEKLVVIVMADRTNRNTNQTGTAVSPSPSPLPTLSTESIAPSPPTAGTVGPTPPTGTVGAPPPTGTVGAPPPTPAGTVGAPPPTPTGTMGTPPPLQGVSPPPPGTSLTNPTSAPVSQPPPNAASSVFLSFVGSLGALMASILVLSF
ncbi:hypothetical protein HN51_043726 [Arachis hypogaea]|uniref:Phytocyanin domain-containing protein n=1 Tax=Arachis hypogaea TaxID=3818 RepID=A0A444Y5J1_ARAHY|nr:early nodulin-like protein 3 [Arachis ipaensis]XP_025672896.1 early nodulin-like protein 3 [Arachis hypogaea]RYQ97180.1 hypothetical protein Ahy_B08g093196 [Arachis hypogaea]